MQPSLLFFHNIRSQVEISFLISSFLFRVWIDRCPHLGARNRDFSSDPRPIPRQRRGSVNAPLGAFCEPVHKAAMNG